MVLDLDVADAGQLLELVGRRLAAEAELDLVVGEIPEEASTRSTRTSRPSRMDRDPIAAPLDLAQDVAGEEDRPAVGDGLAQQREEGLLDERVQAGRGLVQQQQLGLVLQRGDQADLLLVAL